MYLDIDSYKDFNIYIVLGVHYNTFEKELLNTIKLNSWNSISYVASPRAILRIPCYFAHRLQHLKMNENDNSENSMIKNNPFLV